MNSALLNLLIKRAEYIPEWVRDSNGQMVKNPAAAGVQQPAQAGPSAWAQAGGVKGIAGSVIPAASRAAQSWGETVGDYGPGGFATGVGSGIVGGAADWAHNADARWNTFWDGNNGGAVEKQYVPRQVDRTPTGRVGGIPIAGDFLGGIWDSAVNGAMKIQAGIDKFHAPTYADSAQAQKENPTGGYWINPGQQAAGAPAPVKPVTPPLPTTPPMPTPQQLAPGLYKTPTAPTKPLKPLPSPSGAMDKESNWADSVLGKIDQWTGRKAESINLPSLSAPDPNPAFTGASRFFLDPGQIRGHGEGLLTGLGKTTGFIPQVASALTNNLLLPVAHGLGYAAGSRSWDGYDQQVAGQRANYAPDGVNPQFDQWWTSKFGNPYLGGATADNPGGTWAGKIGGGLHSFISPWGELVANTKRQMPWSR